MVKRDSELPRADSHVQSAGILTRVLNRIEKLGNKLPDPAVLFLIGMVATWILSGMLSSVTFTEIDPQRTRVTIVHSGWERFGDDRADRIAGNRRGWQALIAALQAELASS